MKVILPAAAVAALLGATALAIPAWAERGEGHGEGRGPVPRMSFEDLDANGDGQITPDELEARHAARAAALDADGDGYLTEDEMVAFQLAEAEAHIRARVAERFAAADTDGDGKIGVAELEGERRGEMAQRLFDRADANGDGAVSKAEFEAAMARLAQWREGRGHGRHGGEDHHD